MNLIPRDPKWQGYRPVKPAVVGSNPTWGAISPGLLAAGILLIGTSWVGCAGGRAYIDTEGCDLHSAVVGRGKIHVRCGTQIKTTRTITLPEVVEEIPNDESIQIRAPYCETVDNLGIDHPLCPVQSESPTIVTAVETVEVIPPGIIMEGAPPTTSFWGIIADVLVALFVTGVTKMPF